MFRRLTPRVNWPVGGSREARRRLSHHRAAQRTSGRRTGRGREGGGRRFRRPGLEVAGRTGSGAWRVLSAPAASDALTGFPYLQLPRRELRAASERNVVKGSPGREKSRRCSSTRSGLRVGRRSERFRRLQFSQVPLSPMSLTFLLTTPILASVTEDMVLPCVLRRGRPGRSVLPSETSR
jgi:hypothetical protein